MTEDGFVMVQVEPADGSVNTSIKYGNAPFKKVTTLDKQCPLFGDRVKKGPNGVLRLMRQALPPIVWVDEQGRARDILRQCPWPLKVEKPDQGVWTTDFNDPDQPDGHLHLKLVRKLDPEPGEDQGQLEMDRTIVQMAWGLPRETAAPFPHEEEGHRSRYQRIRQEVYQGNRHDFRDRLTFTIDNDDSRDLDDALTIEEIKDGTYVVGIHIADVTAFVDPNSERDLEARARGTSHYYEDQVVHMLPEHLSTDLCSLSPHRDRPTISLYLDVSIDESGRAKIRSSRLSTSLIQSRRQLNYSEADRALKGLASSLPGDIVTALKNALKIGLAFQAGRPEKISAPNEHGVSGELIENFMVTANQVVGERIADLLRFKQRADNRALFRIHRGPSPKVLKLLAKSLENEGLMPPFRIKELMEKARDRQEEEHPANRSVHENDSFLAAALHREIRSRVDLSSDGALHIYKALESGAGGLRIWNAGSFHPSIIHSGHHGLGISRYAWFTSPIRRYPDIINHRFLKASFKGDKSINKLPVVDPHLLHRLINDGRSAQRAYRQRRTFARWLKRENFKKNKEISVTPLYFRKSGPYCLVVTAEIAGLEVSIQIRDCQNAYPDCSGLGGRLFPPGRPECLLRCGLVARLSLAPEDICREAACIFSDTDQWH